MPRGLTIGGGGGHAVAEIANGGAGLANRGGAGGRGRAALVTDALRGVLAIIAFQVSYDGGRPVMADARFTSGGRASL